MINNGDIFVHFAFRKGSCPCVLLWKFKSFRTDSTEGAFVKNGPMPGMPRLTGSPTSAELLKS